MAEVPAPGKDPTEPKTNLLDTKGGLATLFWVAILIVYLILFLGTGWLAFMKEDPNPALKLKPELVGQLKDDATKSFVIDTLKKEAETFQRKRELASQSFNVVLGALLGFLSASATSIFRRKSSS